VVVDHEVHDLTQRLLQRMVKQPPVS